VVGACFFPDKPSLIKGASQLKIKAVVLQSPPIIKTPFSFAFTSSLRTHKSQRVKYIDIPVEEATIIL